MGQSGGLVVVRSNPAARPFLPTKPNFVFKAAAGDHPHVGAEHHARSHLRRHCVSRNERAKGAPFVTAGEVSGAASRSTNLPSLRSAPWR